MKPKPRHLERDYATQFMDPSVAAAYRYRPPYPSETFDIIDRLLRDEPRAVLDVGCGSGAIARPLAARVERVDAVDFSGAMIKAGRGLPGGNSPNLCWIEAAVEEAPLGPRYGLVTAAQSLHWMDWSVVLPRFREALTPSGRLVILERVFLPAPWEAKLREIIPRYSTNQDYAPYDLVEELETRGLFRKQGAHRTGVVTFVQTVAAYVESFHSRNGFSRDRMDPEAAQAFDAEVRDLVLSHVPDTAFETAYVGTLVWGRP